MSEDTAPPIQQFQKPRADAPVIPSLSSRMPIELLVNAEGRALMLHKKELPLLIWWGEYDVELNSLYFVTVKGQVMGYGMKPTAQMRDYMLKAKEIYFQYVDASNKALAPPVIIPLIVRHPEPLSRLIAEVQTRNKAAKEEKFRDTLKTTDF